MPTFDYTLTGLHCLFWGAFALALLMRRKPETGPSQTFPSPPSAQYENIAPFSRSLVVLHVLAFALMYYAVARAVFARKAVLDLPLDQRLLGGFLIAAGTLLAAWALVHFNSWRLRAKLDVGHQLTTSGPFRLLRHPIYAALNLLALGTAVWASSAYAWTAFALVVIISDLRARAEEQLLRLAFGGLYEEYSARTSRFLPWIY